MDLTDEMPVKAEEVANFLKGLANSHRLLVLCALAEGERNVAQLIEATGIAPTSMSQHLAKLKEEGIVDFRREHRTLFYFIVHPAVSELMGILYRHFCKGK
ncbi:Transcriptional regulator, ArsR family [Neorhizobium galegae bv. officinalis bv. officinalis str. HAMBI 1141]|uniref:Transcriptional regulator, ArsR family n=1 Tax=Neorhizobium galegae bv. officinalis bv. officinalis str. HAMBI 1141 TaxID=1028801 RepID=A0A068TAF3_NEOGA|nr:metalloregulator ArsR/SmtB family transcription factor [Neorhizobium galegae]CDN55036.1 Transcriptional regulator, ArsR family [Neorhizobium galegae bv. officinalis bv. officinalis str. HAMBI 1141]